MQGTFQELSGCFPPRLAAILWIIQFCCLHLMPPVENWLVGSAQLLNKLAELTLDIIPFRLSSSHSAFSVFQAL